MTDIADHALESLRPRGVEEVVIVGRRGPLQAAFTTLELRELGDLEGVDVVVDPADFEGITDEDCGRGGQGLKQNIKVLRDYTGREPRPGTPPHGVPVPDLADRDQGRREGRSRSCSAATSWSPTTADGSSAKDTGEREELPVQLVVRAVGYRGVPTPGLPFDEKNATIPNTGGRVDGSRNEYVVGWIKRGPTGVIGTNKKDSQDTVDTLLADLAGATLAEFADDHADKVADWLASRQPKLVTSAHWELIDEFERAAGEPHGRPQGEAAEPFSAAAHQPRLNQSRSRGRRSRAKRAATI